MNLIGAHKVSSPERAYTVHRVSGLLTITVNMALSIAILTTQGRIVATPGMAPLVDWTDGYFVIGSILMASGLIGIAGLAFDDDDIHFWPRMLTLVSASIGCLWFGIVAFSFMVAYANGYQNAGPFLAVCGAILNANRLWLLFEWPKKRPR